jgi:hypothetical protein
MNLILFRGWLGYFSLGLNEVGGIIKARHPSVTVRVREWDQWKATVTETREWKDKFLLVGHSFGVPAMFDFARASDKEVLQYVSMDPSQYVWMTSKISNNTPPKGANVYNFYQVPAFPWSIGGVTIPGATNERVYGYSHAEVDDSPDVQKKTIQLIEKYL